MTQTLAYAVQFDNDQLALHPRSPSLHSSVLHWYLSVPGCCPPAWALYSGVWVSRPYQPGFWTLLCQFILGSLSQSKSGRSMRLRASPGDTKRGMLNCPISQASTHTAAFIQLSRGWALCSRKSALLFMNL